MNFLEQLTAEWYQYKGYFVRTNIKYGKNAKGMGGHSGEMDVVAYDPKTKELTHIECSTETVEKKKIEPKFQKKFFTAKENYGKIFQFPFKNIKTLAIVGFHKTKGKLNLGTNVEVKIIPDFIREITKELKEKNPAQEAIPESYPLLRAIQYGTYFIRK